MKDVIIQDTGRVSATPPRATAIKTDTHYFGPQDGHFGEGDDCAAREGRKQRPLHRIAGNNAIPNTFPSAGVSKR